MSNILAALGRAQLTRLDEMIDKRRGHRLRYRELFANVPGVSIFGEPSGVDGGDTRDNFWLTSIIVDEVEAGFTSSDLQKALAEVNIEARPLWKPMHLQPVHSRLRAFTDGISERLFNTGISLPSGSALKPEEIERIEDAIANFLEKK